MSFFEDASLVLIPSAQKTSKVYSVKPTDGTGDLTFTRSNDTATRVGPDGLIEKVRTNLLLQSNTFSTTWTNNNSTETSGQTGYDGTNNAWFLTAASTSSAYIEQSIVFTGLSIYSIYLKKGTSDFAALTIEGINGGFSYFNLNTGALGSATGVTASIQSIGNGWYRCSISASSTLDGSAVRVYVTDADNSTNVTNGNNILIQAAQLETGDIATDYIATTSAAVSVGPVANVPRLDYLGSSCPRLLLEPQRTNLALYSEQFDNAYFSKVNTAINANALISPDGSTNADKFVATATTGAHYLGVNVTSGSAAVLSVFAKAAEETVFAIGNATGSAGVVFNLSDGTITSGTGGTIENYGNGWYRCSYYRTSWSDFQYFSLRGNVPSYTGNGTDGIYIYGVQFEAGAYATSYIPTLGAAVTRGADVAEKTGISSLIGQTEGTLFLELDIVAGSPNYHTLMQVYGNITNRIAIGQDINSINVFMYINASGTASYQVATVAAGPHKIALAYKNGDSVLYIDGVAAITTTRAITLSTPLSTLFLNNVSGGEIGIFKDSQALVFKTRLSNSSLAELTSL
jgi:hypothetical protein